MEIKLQTPEETVPEEGTTETPEETPSEDENIDKEVGE